MRTLHLAGIAAMLFAGMAASVQNPSIQLDAESFKVTGWTPPHAAPAQGWSSIFVVYAGAGSVPPLLGSYTVDANGLTFRSKFPLASGVHYRAVFRAPGNPPVERIFEGPARDQTRRARVEHVYPTSDVWPANQLRFYVYFSTPMSRGEASRRIRLLDPSGHEVKGAFLPGEELWDPNCQRLTMTFDPGRIKRGLTSNEALGPPLTEGKRYRLVVDGDWPDARGVPMAEGFSKTIRGGPLERVPPNPRDWRITAPKAGTTDAVVVDFPKPMNYPLLQRMIRVNMGSRSIAGSIAVERQETRWSLTPRELWKAGDYQLVVDTGIEDLAGNHIGQPFDIDVFDRVTEHISAKTVSVPFRVP